jgi:hypothetical protein
MAASRLGLIPIIAGEMEITRRLTKFEMRLNANAAAVSFEELNRAAGRRLGRLLSKFHDSAYAKALQAYHIFSPTLLPRWRSFPAHWPYCKTGQGLLLKRIQTHPLLDAEPMRGKTPSGCKT